MSAQKQKPENEFEEASRNARTGLIQELAGFLSENKRWWLTPIIIVLLLLGLLLVLGGTGAAPFIYTLF